MEGSPRLNSSGCPLHHMRRIGPPATIDGVVDIMDFYRVTYMIGRNPLQVDFLLDSSNYIQHAFISRCHARVVRQSENQHCLFDDSLNGIFVNNIKIAGSIVLKEGDRVTFGHPAGVKLPSGMRMRQPDSEYQFMFEKCTCLRAAAEQPVIPTTEPVKVKPSEEFRVPISTPVEALAGKSKKHGRHITQSFTPEDVRHMKRSWDSQQTDNRGNVGEGEQSVSSVHTSRTNGEDGHDNRTIELALDDGEDNGMICNVNDGRSECGEVSCETQAHTNTIGPVKECVIGSGTNDVIDDTNDKSYVACESEMLPVLKSVTKQKSEVMEMKDNFTETLCIKTIASEESEQVTNECKRTKSPTMDASIQTSEQPVIEGQSPTKDEGIQTSQSLELHVLPTNESYPFPRDFPVQAAPRVMTTNFESRVKKGISALQNSIAGKCNTRVEKSSVIMNGSQKSNSEGEPCSTYQGHMVEVGNKTVSNDVDVFSDQSRETHSPLIVNNEVNDAESKMDDGERSENKSICYIETVQLDKQEQVYNKEGILLKHRSCYNIDGTSGNSLLEHEVDPTIHRTDISEERKLLENGTNSTELVAIEHLHEERVDCEESSMGEITLVNDKCNGDLEQKSDTDKIPSSEELEEKIIIDHPAKVIENHEEESGTIIFHDDSSSDIKPNTYTETDLPHFIPPDLVGNLDEELGKTSTEIDMNEMEISAYQCDDQENVEITDACVESWSETVSKEENLDEQHECVVVSEKNSEHCQKYISDMLNLTDIKSGEHSNTTCEAADYQPNLVLSDSIDYDEFSSEDSGCDFQDQSGNEADSDMESSDENVTEVELCIASDAALLNDHAAIKGYKLNILAELHGLSENELTHEEQISCSEFLQSSEIELGQQQKVSEDKAIEEREEKGSSDRCLFSDETNCDMETDVHITYTKSEMETIDTCAKTELIDCMTETPDPAPVKSDTETDILITEDYKIIGLRTETLVIPPDTKTKSDDISEAELEKTEMPPISNNTVEESGTDPEIINEIIGFGTEHEIAQICVPNDTERCDVDDNINDINTGMANDMADVAGNNEHINPKAETELKCIEAQMNTISETETSNTNIGMPNFDTVNENDVGYTRHEYEMIHMEVETETSCKQKESDIDSFTEAMVPTTNMDSDNFSIVDEIQDIDTEAENELLNSSTDESEVDLINATPEIYMSNSNNDRTIYDAVKSKYENDIYETAVQDAGAQLEMIDSLSEHIDTVVNLESQDANSKNNISRGGFGSKVIDTVIESEESVGEDSMTSKNIDTSFVYYETENEKIIQFEQDYKNNERKRKVSNHDLNEHNCKSPRKKACNNSPVRNSTSQNRSVIVFDTKARSSDMKDNSIWSARKRNISKIVKKFFKFWSPTKKTYNISEISKESLVNNDTDGRYTLCESSKNHIRNEHVDVVGIKTDEDDNKAAEERTALDESILCSENMSNEEFTSENAENQLPLEKVNHACVNDGENNVNETPISSVDSVDTSDTKYVVQQGLDSESHHCSTIAGDIEYADKTTTLDKTSGVEFIHLDVAVDSMDNSEQKFTVETADNLTSKSCTSIDSMESDEIVLLGKDSAIKYVNNSFAIDNNDRSYETDVISPHGTDMEIHTDVEVNTDFEAETVISCEPVTGNSDSNTVSIFKEPVNCLEVIHADDEKVEFNKQPLTESNKQSSHSEHIDQKYEEHLAEEHCETENVCCSDTCEYTEPVHNHDTETDNEISDANSETESSSADVLSSPKIVEASVCYTDDDIEGEENLQFLRPLPSLSPKHGDFQAVSEMDEKPPLCHSPSMSPSSPHIHESQLSQMHSPVIPKQGTSKTSIYFEDPVADHLSCNFSDDDDDDFVSPHIDFAHFDDENDSMSEVMHNVTDSEGKPDGLEGRGSVSEMVVYGENECNESDVETCPLEAYNNENAKDVDLDDSAKSNEDEMETIVEDFSPDIDFSFQDSNSNDIPEGNKDIESEFPSGEDEVMHVACTNSDYMENSVTHMNQKDTHKTEKHSAKRKCNFDEMCSPKKLRSDDASSPPTEGISSPFRTPKDKQLHKQHFTPVNDRLFSPRTNHSPDFLCTQMLMGSQMPDLDDFSMTQVDNVTEQLQVKVATTKSSATLSKAKAMLAKIKENRGQKKPVLFSPPEVTSQEVVGSHVDENSQPPVVRTEAQSKLANIDQHISSVRRVLDRLEAAFDDQKQLDYHPRVRAWRQELAAIEEKLVLPKTVVAVVGDTGAGKSSLMNALLDHRSVLPTSGMRACTAVVVEVVLNTMNNNFEADIEFLQRKEWFDELQVLLKDLTGLDGTVKKRVPDPASDAFASYCKVKAVYGRIDNYETLSRLNVMTRWLGKVKVLKSTNPEDFRKQVEKYIETQDPGSGGQYWPIVKHVRLRMPRCDVCSSGASLVDLPGIRDSNAARDKIAKEYMKNCTAVWVVSSIHRAIDDKTAKDLLGENFRRQLLMDGQYGSIAFICTKTDVLMPSEIIRSLHLEDDTKEHEDKISQMEEEKADLDLGITDGRKTVRHLKREMSTITKEMEEAKESFEEIGSILDPGNLEDSQSEENEMLREVQQVVREKEDQLADRQDRIDAAQREAVDSTRKTLELERQLTIHHKAIAAICAKARNEYSKTQIKRDFKAGLREMKRRAGMLADGDEEEDDSADDDDDDDVGSTAENLKVFCCSPTEYQKMKKLLTDDGPAQVFSTVEDTQIPALRNFVHQMTSVRREQGVERLIRSCGRFVFDLQSYTADGGYVKRGIRLNAKSTIDVQLQKFDRSLEPLLSGLSSDIDAVFDTSIRQKVEEGVSNAVTDANTTCAKWGAPMCKDKADRRSGGLHWGTYRATVRRQGVFTSPTYGPVDFNEDLSEPMFRSMTIVWDRAFSGMLWKNLEKAKIEILAKVKMFTGELSRELDSLGVPNDRVVRVNAQLHGSANHKLTEMVAQLKDMVTSKQRDISRIVTPFVQERLTTAYTTCASECGTGMFVRMKTHMATAIDEGRFTIFDSASEQLMRQLVELQEEIVIYVRQICNALLHDLKAAFEPLWESNYSVLREAFFDPVLAACHDIRQVYENAGLTNTEEKAVLPVGQSPWRVNVDHKMVISATGVKQEPRDLGLYWQAASHSACSMPNNRSAIKQEDKETTLIYSRSAGVKHENIHVSYPDLEMSCPATTGTSQSVDTFGTQTLRDLTLQSVDTFGTQTLRDLTSGEFQLAPIEDPTATQTPQLSSWPGRSLQNHPKPCTSNRQTHQFVPSSGMPTISQTGHKITLHSTGKPGAEDSNKSAMGIPTPSLTSTQNKPTPVVNHVLTVPAGTTVPSLTPQIPSTAGQTPVTAMVNQQLKSKLQQLIPKLNKSNQKFTTQPPTKFTHAVVKHSGGKENPSPITTGTHGIRLHPVSGSSLIPSDSSLPTIAPRCAGKPSKSVRTSMSLSKDSPKLSKIIQNKPVFIKTEPKDDKGHGKSKRQRTKYLGHIDLTGSDSD